MLILLAKIQKKFGISLDLHYLCKRKARDIVALIVKWI